jgi:hypothetical protein
MIAAVSGAAAPYAASLASARSAAARVAANWTRSPEVPSNAIQQGAGLVGFDPGSLGVLGSGQAMVEQPLAVNCGHPAVWTQASSTSGGPPRCLLASAAFAHEFDR